MCAFSPPVLAELKKMHERIRTLEAQLNQKSSKGPGDNDNSTTDGHTDGSLLKESDRSRLPEFSKSPAVNEPTQNQPDETTAERTLKPTNKSGRYLLNGNFETISIVEWMYM